MLSSSAAVLLSRLPSRTLTTNLRCLRTSAGVRTANGDDNDKEPKELTKTEDKKPVVFRKGFQALQDSYKELRVMHKGGPEKQTLVKKYFHKPYETTYRANRPIKDPLARTVDCYKPKRYKKTEFLKEGFDAFYDVCIIGGGVMGCSVAYHLASKVYKGLNICVVEKDSTVST